MPVLVTGNAKGVSASDEVSREIWDALVDVGERFGADGVLSTECADLRVADGAPAWAHPVQLGKHRSATSALAAYVRRPADVSTASELVPVTGPANSPKGNTRSRGVLRLPVDGVPVGVCHAPWQPEITRDRYNAALTGFDGVVLVGDLNEKHADVARLFPDCRVHSLGVMHVIVPPGYDSHLLKAIKPRNLHEKADHGALVVRVTPTAPVVTPPKPVPTQEPDMLPSNLPQILRDHGLKVDEVAGWQSRGRPGLFRPGGVLIHHTATTTRSSDSAVLDLLRRGRSDLAGPLCQLGLSRDGTVHVVAAGRANHAGKAKSSGSMIGGDGNQLYIGIEAFNDGVGEPWPKAQYDAYVRLAAVLCVKVTGNSERTVRGHKETSVTGKVDPRFDMDDFRAAVAKVIHELENPTPPRVTPKTSRVATLRAQLLEDLKAGDDIPKNRPAAQAWLKRVTEAVNSGPKS